MGADQSSVYECENCGFRLSATEHPGSCPECGATMQNTAVPRE